MENKKYKYYYTKDEFIEVNVLPQGGFYLSLTDSSKLFGITLETFREEYKLFLNKTNHNQGIVITDGHKFSDEQSGSAVSTIKIDNIPHDFYELLATTYNRDAYDIFKTWLNMILLEKYLETSSLNGEDNATYLMVKYLNKQNEILSANEGICLTAKDYIDYMRHISDSFSASITLINNIVARKKITDDELLFLKSINLSYYNYDLTPENQLQAGSDIKKHLFYSAISPLVAKINEFYNIDNILFIRNDKQNELIVDIYKYNLQPEFLIDFLTEFNYVCSVILKDYNNWFVSVPNTFDNKFDFWEAYSMAENLQTATEKIQYFEKEIIEIEKWMLLESTHNTDRQEADIYIGKCKKAIEIINSENKVSSNNTSFTEKSDKTISLPQTDITLNRQFLALYYLLNEVDKETFARNKSEIARFIQLLTGKNYDNIYKLTKKPIKDPSERTSEKYQTDIQFVKESFLKLGLDKIARQIENDNLVG
jgi:hypothetical protein